MAEEMFPVIEVDAGPGIEFVLIAARRCGWGRRGSRQRPREHVPDTFTWGGQKAQIRSECSSRQV